MPPIAPAFPLFVNRCGRWIWGGARILAWVIFIVLAVRFLAAALATAESPASVWTLAAGFGLAAILWEKSALSGLLLALPLLLGLGRTQLLAFASPALVALLAFGLARTGRLTWRWMRERPPPIAAPPGELRRWLLPLADLLAGWTALVFLVWLPRLLGQEQGPALLRQPVFGYGDPLFPVTDTLIWLAGWFLLRCLLTGTAPPAAAPTGGQPGVDHGRLGPLTGGIPRLVLAGWVVWIVVFWTFQMLWNIPPAYAFDKLRIDAVFFGDPHAMGSVTAALLVAWCALAGHRRWSGRWAWLAALAMAALTGLCYSRAAWLAALAGLGLVLLTARPRLAAVIGGLVVLGLGLVAWKADALLRLNRPFVTRLVYTVRLDRITKNREGRLEIYRRVPFMIADRPWLGHGPGRSFLASAAYAGKDDRERANFIHNTVLQEAVELGLPGGALYAALLLAPLLVAARRRRRWVSDPLARAVFFGAVTYLLTQVTANALNIYEDQQFFFWTLFAIIVWRIDLPANTRPRPPPVSP